MTDTGRRRAPGMTAEQRREMIVRAALPLVAELGAGVTTAKIARAAGIGEATIFRVFEDKNAVLTACVAAAMDPAQVLGELQSISLDQPLAARLTEAIEALDAHLHRMGAVIGALAATGPRSRPAPDSPEARSFSASRAASQSATRQAVLELFEPDQSHLRQPADRVTSTFLGVFFGRHRLGSAEPVPTEDLVDLFLHGALTPAA
ncbi:TetR/AcrR family transcriptional regulator [Actinoplanes bogorensis]|uniref:TetR/AcrR family transcriptional regulator n=1 Tax=Paractinoplanes bogorensis TaxID=1610840 RepID=A0ABS5YNX6_9ACTN|nr:TetR/AcrR family transcriptional regulator [Actinoplanes bogorensis]MBU2665156.1 TetR/AcrR family transcriptional regulator [Actinoplanes bogorensis]